MSLTSKSNASHSARNTHVGVSSREILPTLLDLQSSGTLISVSISGLPGTYLSIVLKADLHKGTLLFDGLRSHQADQQVKAGAIVTVRAKLGVNNVAFDCTVDAPFQLNRTATFSACFPSAMHIIEQRNDYRVRIPEAMSSSALQLNTDDGTHEGRLLDISRHGAGTLLSSKINSDAGSRVSCSFQLLDTRVETAADIRSASEINAHQRLGLLFVDIPASERKRLDSTIAALERIILRDHARLMAR